VEELSIQHGVATTHFVPTVIPSTARDLRRFPHG